MGTPVNEHEHEPMRDDTAGGGTIGPRGDVGSNRTSARKLDPEPRFPTPAPDTRLRMPAEWEPHDATWIAWPHHEPDWPGKLGPIPWVYGEIARILHEHERVEILCHDEVVREGAKQVLDAHGCRADHPAGGYRLHVVPNDR